MQSLALPVAWAAVVVGGGVRWWRSAPLPSARWVELIPPEPIERPPVERAGAAGRAQRVIALLDRLGSVVMARVLLLRGRSPRWCAAMLIAVPVLALAGGWIGVVAVGAALGVSIAARRRRSRRAALDELDSLGALVELVSLGVSAGLGIADAVGRAAEDPTVDPELRRSLLREPVFEAAVREWGAVSPQRRAVGALLVTASHSGAAVGDRLGERAAALRSARRHASLVAARSLSVRLLVPLVCCSLPAFVALSVVPLLAVTASDLPSVISQP